MKNDDQEWLDALAGKNQDSNQTTQQIEAAAVRRSLLARRESIERESEKLDQIQYEKMKQTLMKHGHLAREAGSKSPLQRQLTLIGSFIAGSISSGLLILGLTSQVMVTRSSSESTLIEKSQEVIYKWLNTSQLQKEKITSLNLNDSDPISLAHTLEEKAWEAGLQTASFKDKGSIVLILKNINSKNNNSSEIKLLLGIHPEFNGDVKITISK